AKVVASGTAQGADQTQPGFIGTPAFASPEQFVSVGQTPIDTRADIYSLGVTFWYLLTGRVPFVGRTLRELHERQQEPLPVAQFNGFHVPSRVLGLLKSMLAPDPKDRPQTARELLSAIHRCYARFSTEARARRKRFILAALQKCAGKPGRDRQAAWGCPHPGRKCAEERRRSACERAVDQSR